ncbi:hypothetical protein GCM10027605_40280 [Micromonospora zhanjiangensis]
MRRVSGRPARRSKLWHLPAAVREAHWLIRLIVGGLVTFALAVTLGWALFAVPQAWDGVRATVWGTPGSVTVRSRQGMFSVTGEPVPISAPHQRRSSYYIYDVAPKSGPRPELQVGNRARRRRRKRRPRRPDAGGRDGES